MDENTLESPYRPIRRIAPPDAPLPGVLVACGEETVLLVDIASVPGMLWRPDQAQHVWAPREIARRPDGHDVVLDWCTQTLVAVLTARADGGLDAGEAVTVGVSLLRGHGEALRGDLAAGVGRWWITDQGRPVFVPGDGSAAGAITAEAAHLAARACADTAVARLLTGIADAIAPDARAEAAADLEERLFEAASPTPVRPAPDVPVRIVDLPVAPALPMRVRARDGRASGPASASKVAARAARAVADGAFGLLERVRTARHSTDRSTSATDTGQAPAASGEVPSRQSASRAPHSRLRRTRPLLLGMTVAAIIVTVGLLWTEGDDASTAVDRARDTASRTPQASGASADVADGATSTPDPGTTQQPASDSTAEPDAITGDDPFAAGVALIAAAADCIATKDPCPDVASTPDLLARSATITLAELTDDYGGIAVLRGSAEPGERYLVVEHRDGRWRVRDVLERENDGGA